MCSNSYNVCLVFANFIHIHSTSLMHRYQFISRHFLVLGFYITSKSEFTLNVKLTCLYLRHTKYISVDILTEIFVICAVLVFGSVNLICTWLWCIHVRVWRMLEKHSWSFNGKLISIIVTIYAGKMSLSHEILPCVPKIPWRFLDMLRFQFAWTNVDRFMQQDAEQFWKSCACSTFAEFS